MSWERLGSRSGASGPSAEQGGDTGRRGHKARKGNGELAFRGSRVSFFRMGLAIVSSQEFTARSV